MKVIWWWVGCGGAALGKNQDISELRSSWSIYKCQNVFTESQRILIRIRSDDFHTNLPQLYIELGSISSPQPCTVWTEG